jgi:MoaA/NifB/PqqE/SkfB family radical SAM enzyme
MSRRMREPRAWERLKDLLTGSRRMLDWMQVEVSSRCAGRCTYCPHTLFKERWRGRDMDINTFQRLWPLMRRAARVHLQGWGEPLLNPAFFEMADMARKAGCAVSTTTCGLTLKDETACKLVDSGMDIVAVSLSGTDETGNAARLGVPFEQVCAGVERLQAVRRAKRSTHPKIHFAYLLLASNMSDVRALPALMRRLGIHATVVSTLDYLPDPALAEETFLPEQPEKLAAARKILAETADEADRLGVIFDYRLPRWELRGAGCSENIARSLFVSTDGDISPCVFVNIPSEAADNRRRTFGNIHSADPLAIWNKPDYRAFRERLGRGEPDPICRSCPKRFMA